LETAPFPLRACAGDIDAQISQSRLKRELLDTWCCFPLFGKERKGLYQ
jgi:hypothetical protein